jgi:hypothetical protein
MRDWQSFLDGAMPGAEKAALEQELACNAALKADFEGFHSFVCTMREAHGNERIPEGRLESILSSVVAPAPKARPFLRVWGPRFAVAATLGFVLYAGSLSTLRDPVAPVSSPEREMQVISQPALAANFVRERTGYRAAPISLGKASARLICTRVGNEWACYEYEINGRKVTLVMTTSDRFDRGTPCINCDGVQTYRGTTGIGWRYGGLAYYMRGADMDSLRSYARVAVSELKQSGSTQY